MSPQLAELIQDNSQGELELYENYSGRGMYGNTTTGLTGDLNTFIQSVARATRHAVEDDEEDLVNELCYDLSIQIDSIGLDKIFY